MKLTEYMKQAEKVYKDNAPAYVKLVKAEQAAREEIYKVRSSRELTPEGKEKRIAELRALENDCRDKRMALSKAAKAEALKVRQEVEKRFYSKYHARPDALDMEGLELLKSGILTDSELTHLAESYSGNCTMQRICGKYMEQSKDRNVSSAGRVLQMNASEPHLKAMDAIIHVGDYAMGGAPLSGAAGSEYFFNRFDEMTASAYADAPDVDA